MTKRSSTHLAMTVACLLGSSGMALADGAPDIKELTGAAQFVAQTRVAKVEYRMSGPGPNGQAAVPYTIVTYNLVQPVRGGAASPSFTVRYVGGPDGRGGFLEASHVPVFQVGDEDILFVRGNGQQGCPLVSCIEGRFRVLGGAVYNGTGAPVRAVANGKVVAHGAAPAEFRTIRYPAPDFDELIKNPEARAILSQQGLSIDEARRRYRAETPATIEITTVSASGQSRDAGAGNGRAAAEGALQAAARPMTVESFVAQVRSVAVPQRQSAAAFHGMNAEGQIVAPSPQPAAPGGQIVIRNAAPQQRSPADVAEERGLPQDDPMAVTRAKSR